jgi:hypothetical protein
MPLAPSLLNSKFLIFLIFNNLNTLSKYVSCKLQHGTKLSCRLKKSLNIPKGQSEAVNNTIQWQK